MTTKKIWGEDETFIRDKLKNSPHYEAIFRAFERIIASERAKVAEEIKEKMGSSLPHTQKRIKEKYLGKKPELLFSCDAKKCLYCKKPIKEGNCCEACMKRILEGKKPEGKKEGE